MSERKLFVSHESALFYWRTNPPRYVLDEAIRGRSLRGTPASSEELAAFNLSEAEFGPFPMDILVSPSASKPQLSVRCHVQKAQLPPRTLVPIRDGIHVVSPALCLLELCNSLSFVQGLELGMELCGTYALRPDSPEPYASRGYQLESIASLKSKFQDWSLLHGVKQARSIARYLVDGAASPMESKVYLMLCLPLMYGGFNLPRPEMNAEISLPEKEMLMLRQQHVKPDFLWRKQKIVIEYDGAYHDDPGQRLHDEARRVALETLGYTVVALKKQHVYDRGTFEEVAEMLRVKLGVHKRAPTFKQECEREHLRELLLV